MAVATVPLHVSPTQLTVITAEEISRYAEITSQLSLTAGLRASRIDGDNTTIDDGTLFGGRTIVEGDNKNTPEKGSTDSLIRATSLTLNY